jgi:hypothetical protein
MIDFRGVQFPKAIILHAVGVVAGIVLSLIPRLLVPFRMLTMSHKFNADRRDKITKQKYWVTNWADYNESLRQRGDLTV